MDRGVVATDQGALTIAEIELPTLADDEVRVRIEACGVCRSDLHVLETGWAHHYPVLLGHEAAGVVEETGGAVAHLEEGDTVILGWRAPCGRCPACRRGDPRRCRRPASAHARPRLEDGQELSVMLGLGCFASRVVVPAAAAIAYPSELRPAEACLVGCCVATGVGSVTETARLAPGARVAVIGCGPVGLNVIQGARLSGAEEIIAVDPNTDRAETARLFGATSDEITDRLDAVFDVVGTAQTFAAGVAALGYGGAYVLVGVPLPATSATFELQGVFDRRLRLLVSHGGDHLPAEDFPLLATRALAGEIDLRHLVTKEIALEDVATAFADMRAGRGVRSVVTNF
jgi:S-(hydroxymethyl)mycothiol dehydrogenase